MFGLVTGAGNAMINDLNGEDTIEKIIDMGQISYYPFGA